MWIEGHWQQVRICCSRFGCSGSFFVAVNPKAVAVLRRDKHNCCKNSSAVAEMPAIKCPVAIMEIRLQKQGRMLIKTQHNAMLFPEVPFRFAGLLWMELLDKYRHIASEVAD